jgi:hypothetical protein
LKRVDPDVLILINSYSKEVLIEACQAQSVPTIEFQHGTIHESHLGYSYPDERSKQMFPDYLFTFGEFWKEAVSYPIPKDRVRAVGYPYLESHLENEPTGSEGGEELLFISQAAIGKKLSKLAVEASQHPEFEHDITYKLHPKEYNGWHRKYPNLVSADISIIAGPDPTLYDLFRRATAQIGVFSTAVYEGLCFDLDTYIYNLAESASIRALIQSGVATKVDDVDQLVEGVKERSEPFDREYFFDSNAVEKMRREIAKVKG